MADYIERENPYDKIGNAVEKWCKENMYTTMLVTISIGYEWETPHEETHLLVWDGERCELVWEIDWWEGQQHVELVGFAPTYKIRLVGADADVAPVRHGYWVWDEDGMDWGIGSWRCSECHTRPETWWQGNKSSPYNKSGHYYCPNCGAQMDKEGT